MILVTGGTGRAGSFIVSELRQRGHQVRVLTRPSSAKAAEALGVGVVVGDLSDHDSLHRAVEGVTGIVHVACTFTQPEVDDKAMVALTDTWTKGPFVFISSVSVYGYSRWLPTTEDHPLDADFPYGLSKIRCEALLMDAARAKGRDDVSILRPPHIWGPDRRFLEHEASPVADLYRKICSGEPVVLPGETEDVWTEFGDDWVDARELAWVVAECLTRPLSGAANVINRHFIWHDFCTELVRLTGSPCSIEHRGPNIGFFAQPWRYSCKRLQGRLGFRPSHEWQETLAEMVA